MRRALSTLFSCLLASVVAYADPVTVPNTFTAGTPAKASEVNANFNALANAINSNAGPKPLMVYDSTGKLVGQYYPSPDYPVVVVTTLGESFSLSLNTSGLTSPYSDFYYTSSNCSGEFLIRGGYDSLIPRATVRGTNAYVPQITVGQPVTTNFISILSANPFPCFTFTDGGLRYEYLAPAARVVDLTIFTPPFSVH